MVAVSWFRQLRSRQFEDERSRVQLPAYENSCGQLMKVTAATPISFPNKRWLYTVAKQIVQPATSNYTVAASADTTTQTALSVSELSNANTYYSYGVQKANIPAGFNAVQIPVGTFVWCVPHRTSNGEFIWLIVNTQAIDGVC
jgi:hypothetical protein